MRTEIIQSPFPSKRGKLASALRNLSGTLLILAILFVIFIAYGWIFTNRWYRLLVVHSASMTPTFNVGDMILITPPTEQLEPGMIVTFQVGGELVTHRITEITADGYIRTKGDANENQDRWTDREGKEKPLGRVIGIYRLKIPYLGYILRYPRTIFDSFSTGAWFADIETSQGNSMRAGTWDLPPSESVLVPPKNLTVSNFRSPLYNLGTISNLGGQKQEGVQPSLIEVSTDVQSQSNEGFCLFLEWDDSKEVTIVGYKVYHSLGQNDPFEFEAETEISYFADCNLQSGTHFYVVTVFDHDGMESGKSNLASGTVPVPESIVESTEPEASTEIPQVTPTETLIPDPTEETDPTENGG